VLTGSRRGIGIGGGSRARCMLLSRPSRAHCALRALVVAASSEIPASSPPPLVAGVPLPDRVSTVTPLLCKYSTSAWVKSEPFIRMPRKRSACVRGGGDAASAPLAASPARPRPAAICPWPATTPVAWRAASPTAATAAALPVPAAAPLPSATGPRAPSLPCWGAASFSDSRPVT